MSPRKIEDRDSMIYEMPPNTQGLTTLHILKLLEERGHRMDPNSTERIKRYLDIYKIAYFIRDNYITDPRYMKLNVEEMLSIDFIKGVMVQGGSDQGSNSNGDTTYFCIADKDGNMVSGVQSIFYPFGSYLTEPKYCITLNSRASSFVLDKEHVNSLQPDKKPLHTLSDLIVKTSDNILALGLSGGHFRPQLHALILTNILDYNMDIQTALEYPRFVWIPGTRDVRAEKGYEEREIENYNVNFLSYPSRLGVAAACISRVDGVKIGYTDIRGEGIPLGPI
jgi:gamma-glutamyltranspeptidase/glutathione hydrolase